MKKHASTIILVIVLVAGIALLLYPTVSNYLNQINASQAIANYDEAVNGLTDEQMADLLAQAASYNADLAADSSQTFQDGDPVDERYRSLLDVSGNGVIGYVTIRKLGVKLPIYHGTSSQVLVSAAGHLEGSSLPVGGTSTHAVITGHRGLPSAKLFTDLDRMDVGDTFTITVLNETLTYRVDLISIVDPDQTEKLEIVPDEDHVTLLTCTPYGVNTQRLLVRAVRTDAETVIDVPADATLVDPTIVAPILAVPLLLILLVLLLTRTRSRSRVAKTGAGTR